MRKRIVRIGVVVAWLAAAAALTAAPAQASVSDFVCSPSTTGWDLKGDWGNGVVLEARTCLQWDDSTNKVRTRQEWRVRDGGTPLSGTDWDIDSNGDNIPYEIYTRRPATGSELGKVVGGSDIFNTSYIARYSNWSCWNVGTPLSLVGEGKNIRATPPGYPRSDYHADQTYSADNTNHGICPV